MAAFEWGVVPVLEIGDKTLSQSSTIARYLGKKFNLAGENEWDAAKIDEFSDALTDLINEWAKCHKEQDETKKAVLRKEFLENVIPRFLPKFDKQIASNGGTPFVVGRKVSWLDFQLAHVLSFFETQVPGVLDAYEHLKKLKAHVFSLPKIKAHVEKRPVTPF